MYEKSKRQAAFVKINGETGRAAGLTFSGVFAMLKAKEDFGKARDIRGPFYTAGGVNMVSTVSIFEMNLIINCEHKDPHTIL